MTTSEFVMPENIMGDSGRLYRRFVIPERVVGLHFYFSCRCGKLDSILSAGPWNFPRNRPYQWNNGTFIMSNIMEHHKLI